VSDVFFLAEAAHYLKFDTLAVKSPERMVHRLVAKGALPAKKISGKLAFAKRDLDAIAERGSERPRRGRPLKKREVSTN
jgi:hypothetical protein